MSTPFLRDETLFRFVFSPDIWGLALNIWVLKGPAFPAKKNITKTKHSQKARQGHIKHVCKISGSYLSKTYAWGFLLFFFARYVGFGICLGYLRLEGSQTFSKKKEKMVNG